MNQKPKSFDVPDQEQVWDEIAESWNERRRLPGPIVLKFVKESKGNFLDLGCGSGRNLVKNKNSIFYLVDFSQNMINLAEKKAKKLKLKFKLIKTDVSDLRCFEDNFFDNALFIATLHCLDKKKRNKTLKEIYRVLKKKGIALISVWSTNHPAFKRFKNKKEILLAWVTNQGKANEKRNLRYYYFYTKDEFIDDLKKAGFNVLNIKDTLENTGLSAKVEKI
jgi:ubiquinone/menaquinone biosynthesis C-methylase UbiE